MNERIKELAEQAVLTQESVRELFNYVDGKLFWKIHKPHSRFVGKEAGFYTGNGYKQVTINRKKYLTHRVVWLYHNGYFPDVVDHINNIKDDNRIENLRSADRSKNQHNRAALKESSSGYKNVSWCKNAKKWRVSLCLKSKSHHFGLYDDLELADLVATMAREKYHGDFANHGTTR
jgi:hypothetical protein